MKVNEIRLYTGIIISNILSVLLILLIAIIHTQIQNLASRTLWLGLVGGLCIANLIATFFWRKLPMQISDYLKFYVLNLLVSLFWIMVLIL